MAEPGSDFDPDQPVEITGPPAEPRTVDDPEPATDPEGESSSDESSDDTSSDEGGTTVERAAASQAPLPPGEMQAPPPPLTGDAARQRDLQELKQYFVPTIKTLSVLELEFDRQGEHGQIRNIRWAVVNSFLQGLLLKGAPRAPHHCLVKKLLCMPPIILPRFVINFFSQPGSSSCWAASILRRR